MLVSFSVSNFLSFDEEQRLSLTAGLVRKNSDRLFKDNSGNRLVKLVALFGANASGKSNLVEAIKFSRWLILKGFPLESTKMYCRVKEENKELDTVFKYRLIINNHTYEYEIRCNLVNRIINSETLSEIVNEKHKVVFEKDIIKQKFFIKKFKSSQLNYKLKIYLNDIQEEQNVLFLKVLNQNKNALYSEHPEASIFKILYNWFNYRLSVNFPERIISPYSYFLSTDNKDTITKILQAYDTGIIDYSIVDNTNEMLKTQIPENMYKNIISELQKLKDVEGKEKSSIILRSPRELYILKLDDDNNLTSETLQFTHKSSTSSFSINEESDGTTRLMDLMTILLDKRSKGVYVLDEIDRCLHPQLTTRFIMDFLYLAKKRNIQLIVTTHESSLLDFEILRKDEIWFVNKEDGISSIYPLENFSERFDKKIEYAYKNGDYKAKPNFENIYPLLDDFWDQN